MTDKNKTEIVIVLDRSGSMASIASDMEGGVNRFLKEQAAQPGECIINLYRFDSAVDVVFENLNAKDVGNIRLDPRDSTALLDAVGTAITRVGQKLAAQAEDKRAGAVIVLIVTDGQENCSKEYKRDQIRAMTKEQTDKYGWKFLYLGADASTFSEAVDLGMQSSLYTKSARGTEAVYSASSNAVSNYRSAVRSASYGAKVDLNINKDLTTDEKPGLP